MNELPVSGLLAWFGPLVLAGITYAQYKELRNADYALGVAAIGSLSLVFWMVSHHSICLLCMLVHIGVVSAALALGHVPKLVWVKPIPLLFFSFAIAYTATGGWDQFAQSSEVGIFRPRDKEVVPAGKVYVLFTDPECSRCVMAENQIKKLATQPNILYRWTILPQNLYRSVRAAAMLEMARLDAPQQFDKLRESMIQAPPPFTDTALVTLANQVGLDSKVHDWLDHPSERALIALEDDRTTSEELKIRSLPALAELSPPDATGMRTLRLVPFSRIGL